MRIVSIKDYSPFIAKDPKKIAPKAFEYRLNLHKKTSNFFSCSTQYIKEFIDFRKSFAQRVFGESSMLETNSDASSKLLQNLHVPR